MKKLVIFNLLIFLWTFSFAPAFADSKSGGSKSSGIYVSFHGDPAPSALGLNLVYQPTDFMRLNAGVGGYSDWMGPSLGPGLYNVTFRPLLFGISYAFIYFFTLLGSVLFGDFGAKVVKLRYGSFKSGLFEEAYKNRSLFTYGGGLKFLVPKMKLSPVAGVNISRYETKGSPWGLSSTGSMLYYTAGMDLTTDSGFNLGAGFNICPKQNGGSCGFYINVGGFF